MPKPQAKTVLTRAPASEHPIAPRTEPLAAASAVPTEAKEAAQTEMHSARIPAALKQRMKIHSATTNLSMQEITELALTEWLDRHPS